MNSPRTGNRRLLRLGIVALLVMSVLVSFSGSGMVPTAGAAGPNQYSAPDWWPLRGTNLIGCSKNSPGEVCGGNYHPGWAIDIEGDEGQPVYASGAGLATVYTNVTGCSDYGQSVVVSHGGTTKSLYGHLSAFSTDIASNPNGVWVDENTVIGYMGHTGNVSNCSYTHLHYEETTNGAFWLSATDPGALKACKDGRLVTYPQELGQPSWLGLRAHIYPARSDGTACAGGPTTAPSTTTTTTTTTPPPVNCPSVSPTIVGTNGDDKLAGTPGSDVIFGLSGNDQIAGMGGDDVICGGEGNDDISGGAGNDRLFGGPGDDDFVGGAGDDQVTTGDGRDRIARGPGDTIMDLSGLDDAQPSQ